MDKTVEKGIEAIKESTTEKVAEVLPKPSKKGLIISLVVITMLLVGLTVLGYFYYVKSGQYNAVVSEKEQLMTQLNAKTKEVEEVQGSIPDTGPLEEQITDLKAKIAKAQAYNGFFKYLNSVIEIHNGFTGWTDAEYQTGRGLALKTGNSSFVAVVDNAWNNQQQPVTDRVISVWKAVSQGIETALK
jgi:hypothetical protein